jgi:dTDP-glucose pyrophosphorylase
MIHSDNLTITRALKELNLAKYKCLILVDKNKVFSGTLTDGDLRRAILKGAKFKDKIKKYIFKNSFFLRTNNLTNINIEKIFNNKNNDILAIPILDNQNKVVKVIYPDIKSTKFHKKKLNNTVVIVAGGKGQRLEPFTSILPKPLAPIDNKTLLEQIMLNFKNYNMSKFLISINYKKEIIKAYFKDNNDFKISFIEEKNPTGTAGCLKFLKNKVSNDFLLTNCDVMADINYHHLIDFHKKNQFDFTLIVSKRNFKIPYGVCEVDKDAMLKRLIEKPNYDYFVNIGLYVIKREVLKFLPKKNYLDMNEFIEVLLKKNKKVGIYPISDKGWLDTGQWHEYKAASEKFKELFNK